MYSSFHPEQVIKPEAIYIIDKVWYNVCMSEFLPLNPEHEEEIEKLAKVLDAGLGRALLIPGLYEAIGRHPSQHRLADIIPHEPAEPDTEQTDDEPLA